MEGKNPWGPNPSRGAVGSGWMLGESDGSGKITEEEAESVKESEGQDTCREAVSYDYDREAAPLEFKKYYCLK